MSVEGIDVQETLDKAKRLLKKEKNLSPALQAVVEVLMVLVSVLVGRLGLHSRNSHIPPSKDPLRYRRTKSPGQRKKPRGQAGHVGSTLKRVGAPDEIEDIRVDRRS